MNKRRSRDELIAGAAAILGTGNMDDLLLFRDGIRKEHSRLAESV
jgi:hypothetical protein